jgi:hypothetical protein
MVTKKLFDFGIRHNEIYYMTHNGRVTIPTDWKKYIEDSGNSNVPMTLPF